MVVFVVTFKTEVLLQVRFDKKVIILNGLHIYQSFVDFADPTPIVV